MVRVLESVQADRRSTRSGRSRWSARSGDRRSCSCTRSGSRSALWRTIRRARATARPGRAVSAIHLALALGLAVGLVPPAAGLPDLRHAVRTRRQRQFTWRDGVVYGVRIGADLHGIRRPRCGSPACSSPSWSPCAVRRLYSIARLSVYEANRRMWAPWVVITVFLLVLAFTHWFLQPPRAAEMGRLYVGTLTLLCSVLLTVMVTILTPLSLPTDIQQQTIYTVVSKPVRRLELIWGRMIGYMALVTVLVVVFGGISLLYLWRTVGSTIDADRGGGGQGPEGGPDDRVQAADASRPTSSARGCRPACRSRGRCRSSTRAGRRTRWGSTSARSSLDARAAEPHRGGDARRRRSGASAWSPTRSRRRAGSPDPRPPDPGRATSSPPARSSGTWTASTSSTAQIETAKHAKAAAQRVGRARSAELDAAIARNQAELERVRSEYDAKQAAVRRAGSPGRRGRGRRRQGRGRAAAEARSPSCTRRRSPSR